MEWLREGWGEDQTPDAGRDTEAIGICNPLPEDDGSSVVAFNKGATLIVYDVWGNTFSRSLHS